MKVGQLRRPGPNGPFTLAAKGNEKVDGKFPTVGQFNVSKEDYEVIQWLARNGREARYKVEIDPAKEGENKPAAIPDARIAGVQLLNASRQFTSIDWKSCREEFEKADKKVQSPKEREAQKSSEVESQIATGIVPGAAASAPPKREEVESGPLPLPKLRPLSVPQAVQLQQGPSLSK